MHCARNGHTLPCSARSIPSSLPLPHVQGHCCCPWSMGGMSGLHDLLKANYPREEGDQDC